MVNLNGITFVSHAVISQAVPALVPGPPPPARPPLQLVPPPTEPPPFQMPQWLRLIPKGFGWLLFLPFTVASDGAGEPDLPPLSQEEIQKIGSWQTEQSLRLYLGESWRPQAEKYLGDAGILPEKKRLREEEFQYYLQQLRILLPYFSDALLLNLLLYRFGSTQAQGRSIPGSTFSVRASAGAGTVAASSPIAYIGQREVDEESRKVRVEVFELQSLREEDIHRIANTLAIKIISLHQAEGRIVLVTSSLADFSSPQVEALRQALSKMLDQGFGRWTFSFEPGVDSQSTSFTIPEDPPMANASPGGAPSPTHGTPIQAADKGKRLRAKFTLTVDELVSQAHHLVALVLKARTARPDTEAVVVELTSEKLQHGLSSDPLATVMQQITPLIGESNAHASVFPEGKRIWFIVGLPDESQIKIAIARKGNGLRVSILADNGELWDVIKISTRMGESFLMIVRNAEGKNTQALIYVDRAVKNCSLLPLERIVGDAITTTIKRYRSKKIVIALPNIDILAGNLEKTVHDWVGDWGHSHSFLNGDSFSGDLVFVTADKSGKVEEQITYRRSSDDKGTTWAIAKIDNEPLTDLPVGIPKIHPANDGSDQDIFDLDVP